MSRLKLLLPGGKSLTIASPFKNQTKNFANFSLILNFVSLVLVSVFALFLPLSSQFFSQDSETSTLKYLILFVLLFLIVFLLKILIQGNSFLIEPKGLLLILIFNLVLTSISVTVTTLRVSNTFGTIGFRSLSGLALMSLIGLFYFLNLYSLNIASVRKIFGLMGLGTIIYLIVHLLSADQTVTQATANLPLLVTGFSLLAYTVLRSTTRIFGSILLFIVGILMLISVPISSASYGNLLYFSLIFIVAYVMVLTLFTLRYKTQLKDRFRQIKKNIQNFIQVKKVKVPTNKGLADLHLVLIYILPIIVLITALFFFLNIHPANRTNLFTSIAQYYNDGFRQITGGTYQISGETLRPILLGVGSDNYNPSLPFLVNVLIVSGLVGTSIYLYLWVYFIKAAKDLFQKKLRLKKDFKITGIILFLVILLPLNLMISYSNLLTVILLWIMFAIVSALQTPFTINYFDNTIAIKNKTRLRWGVNIAITAALVAGIIYTINFLFILIK